jgi:peptidoglycan L-alanyl-D-glutamate endopeptidase CwlK
MAEKAKTDIYAGVEPSLVARCRAIETAMIALGFRLRAVQGVRTAEYQHALWQQGREKPGKIVTNADGYQAKSNHQAKADGYGHAIDFCFLDHNNQPSFDDHWPWALIGAMAEALQLIWGGRFKSIVDSGHVELPVSHALVTTAKRA